MTISIEADIYYTYLTEACLIAKQYVSGKKSNPWYVAEQLWAINKKLA